MQAEAFSEYVGSCDYRYIRVQLQYRSRYPWRDRSGQRLPENFPFSLSGQQEDFFACKIEAIPMVIACLGTCPALAKNLAFARIVS